MRIAVLGFGKMGSILVDAFVEKEVVSENHVVATVRHSERARALNDAKPFPVGNDNRGACASVDVVLICVKPQAVEAVCRQIGPGLGQETLVISIAASVPTSSIERFVGGSTPVVRAMPNTPCRVGEGMTALCQGAHAGKQHLLTAQRLFDTVGRTVVIDEKHMDAATGLSASGPAFIYVILESIAEAGVKLGLARDTATLLAAQTAHGAALEVLETGAHPALLKDEVTTPAGCTIDGLLELEEGKLRVTLIKAVVKAAERSRELYVEKGESAADDEV